MTYGMRQWRPKKFESQIASISWQRKHFDSAEPLKFKSAGLPLKASFLGFIVIFSVLGLTLISRGKQFISIIYYYPWSS